MGTEGAAAERSSVKRKGPWSKDDSRAYARHVNTNKRGVQVENHLSITVSIFSVAIVLAYSIAGKPWSYDPWWTRAMHRLLVHREKRGNCEHTVHRLSLPLLPTPAVLLRLDQWPRMKIAYRIQPSLDEQS